MRPTFTIWPGLKSSGPIIFKINPTNQYEERNGYSKTEYIAPYDKNSIVIIKLFVPLKGDSVKGKIKKIARYLIAENLKYTDFRKKRIKKQ